VKISKSSVNYSLVALLGAGGLVEAVSGFALWFGLPRGGGNTGRAAVEFMGLVRREWTDLHDWAAVALVVIVLVHFAIHWKWWVRVTRDLLHLNRSKELPLVAEKVKVKIRE
jgi:hypothetical protein